MSRAMTRACSSSSPEFSARRAIRTWRSQRAPCPGDRSAGLHRAVDARQPARSAGRLGGARKPGRTRSPKSPTGELPPSLAQVIAQGEQRVAAWQDERDAKLRAAMGDAEKHRRRRHCVAGSSAFAATSCGGPVPITASRRTFIIRAWSSASFTHADCSRGWRRSRLRRAKSPPSFNRSWPPSGPSSCPTFNIPSISRSINGARSTEASTGPRSICCRTAIGSTPTRVIARERWRFCNPAINRRCAARRPTRCSRFSRRTRRSRRMSE